MDRRQFVIGSAGLATASSLSAKVWKKPEKLKFGILGVGMRGQVHI